MSEYGLGNPEMAVDTDGKVKRLQPHEPAHRPKSAEPDCAYCEKKRICIGHGRRYFESEKYPVCEQYVDYTEQLEKDRKRIEELKELRKITIPSVRPDKATPDCLYCKQLKTPHNWRGPWQGEGAPCENYNEVKARPATATQHCFYCLGNYRCTRGRVLTNGKPCERYREITCEG